MIFNSFNRVVLIGFVLILFSCRHQTSKQNSQFEIKKTDFVSRIFVSGQLEAANSVTILCPQLYSDLTVLYLVPEGSKVSKGDTVCILEAPEIQNKYETSLNELEIAKTQYNKTFESLQLQYLLLKSQVQTIEASAKISELNSLQKEFVSESDRKIIELEIQKSEVEKQKLQFKLKSLKVINESELTKMKLKIDQSRNNVNRAKDVLSNLYITTPVEGLVEYIKQRHTGKKIGEGDIVWGNMPLINIPDISKMKAKLTVSESDYKRIMPGQDINFTIDAFPDIRLNGKIERKSAAGHAVQRKSPVKVFDIYASVDSVNMSLQPGLSLSGEVIAENIKDTICIPLTSLFENDTVKFVYLKKNKKYRKHEVEVGQQSSTHIIVTHGLKENDIISLIAPF
jgi:HlyD family secretion protein